MAESPLQFEFPSSLTVDQFIKKLSAKTSLQLVSKRYCIKTYYDSFDWRLYAGGIICEFHQDRTATILDLVDLETGLPVCTQKLDRVPAFAWDFNPGPLRKILEPLLEMRALLPITTLDFELYSINILNRDEKTVLRLNIEIYDLLKNRVSLLPVKGYDKPVSRISTLITTKLGLTATAQPVLSDALNLQGRKPLDYSSKLNLKLKGDIRADKACLFIYQHLLSAIKANELGSIENTDSEFLHDFRVAVRKTRSGLSQIKDVLPEKITAKYAEFFAWLGQITSQTRDFDVYLLNFDTYKKSLPVGIREDLNPLYDFLSDKQQLAQQQLAKQLKTKKYLNTLAEWEHYLKKAPPKQATQAHAMLSIRELADRRIWRVYKRVLKQGNAISEQSPAEALHELRKTCKKLRYLMEFFQSLYPTKNIKSLIKTLKGFQEVLGDFQDFQVQESALKKFSVEMMHANTPAATFLAMGVLVLNLDARSCRARHDFAKRFAAFKLTSNQQAFRALFAGKEK